MQLAIPTSEGFTLEGVLHGDAATAPGAIVLGHPHPAFGGTMDTPLVAALAEAVAAAGRVALRFNFRGVGASGGRASGGADEHRDLLAAVAFLRARGFADVALAGYSFGALMGLRALAEGLDVRAFAAIAIPTVIIHGEEREAHCVQGLSRAPTLLLAGTEDQFCELPRLRAWAAGRPGVRLVALAGEGHFFTGAALADVVARSVSFLTA